jgi:hypothetical protein
MFGLKATEPVVPDGFVIYPEPISVSTIIVPLPLPLPLLLPLLLLLLFPPL